jgi:hypothetical protein
VQASVNWLMLIGSIALFFAAILFVGFLLPSLAMAQLTTTPITSSPPSLTSPTTTSPLSLTPQEQVQQNRLQNITAAIAQSLAQGQREIAGVVFTPRWSDPVWIEPGSSSVLFAYCLPGELAYGLPGDIANPVQGILGGSELVLLDSYAAAVTPDLMMWFMIVQNQDIQIRLPAAVGVVCASDVNDAQSRILSPVEQQEVNNIIQQFVTLQNRPGTTTTNIDQVINIINNGRNQNTTTAGGGIASLPSTTPSRDVTSPTLTIPNDMALQTNGPTALLVYSVTAQDDKDGTATLDEDNQLIQGDNVGGNIFISCRPSSQYFLPVDSRLVQCFAADAVNNTAQASFIVTVRNTTSPAGPTDTIAPSLSVPVTRVIPTTSPTGQERVLYDVSATDNVDGTARLDANNILIQEDNVRGSVAISCDPSSNTNFRLGNHTVQCRAIDAAGNRGTASFIVAVTNTTANTSPGGSSSGGVGGITISDLHIDFLSASGPVASDTNTYNGSCPVGASISGTITDNVGNRDVTYRLIMNDGGSTAQQVIHFDQPGSQTVSFGIQTLGGFNNVQSYQGWFAIEILQPVQLQSQRAEFDIICTTPSTGGAPPAPQTLQAENDTAATTDEEDTAATTTDEEDTTTDEEDTTTATTGGGETPPPPPPPPATTEEGGEEEGGEGGGETPPPPPPPPATTEEGGG